MTKKIGNLIGALITQHIGVEIQREKMKEKDNFKNKKGFIEFIKKDTTSSSINTIRRNHISLSSALKCEYCKLRLQYLIKK